MKKIYLISTLLIASYVIFAQESSIKKNNVYTELKGNGIWYSLNYERIFSITSSIALAPRIGGSYMDAKFFEKGISIPIGINLLIARGREKFEIGATATYLKTSGNPEQIFYSPIVGFRLQPKEGGTLFRVTYTPLIENKEEIYHSFGISIGYNF